MGVKAPLVLAIVGAGADKFNIVTKIRAIRVIMDLIGQYKPTVVISGASPLGGIDEWADELAAPWCETREYPPATQRWSTGYKLRNIQLAEEAQIVCSIVVDQYPEKYEGMRFPYCYHCGKPPTEKEAHVKSGGCWTAKYARSIGKMGYTIIVRSKDLW